MGGAYDSSLMPGSAVETPQQSDWTSCCTQLAYSVIPCSHLASVKRASKIVNFKRRCCKCRAVIVRCAGLPCTRMTLMLNVYHAWGNPTLMPPSAGLIALTESFSLASLRSRIAFFSESDSATPLLAPSHFLPPRDL